MIELAVALGVIGLIAAVAAASSSRGKGTEEVVRSTAAEHLQRAASTGDPNKMEDAAYAASAAYPKASEVVRQKAVVVRKENEKVLLGEAARQSDPAKLLKISKDLEANGSRTSAEAVRHKATSPPTEREAQQLRKAGADPKKVEEARTSRAVAVAAERQAARAKEEEAARVRSREEAKAAIAKGQAPKEVAKPAQKPAAPKQEAKPAAPKQEAKPTPPRPTFTARDADRADAELRVAKDAVEKANKATLPSEVREQAKRVEKTYPETYAALVKKADEMEAKKQSEHASLEADAAEAAKLVKRANATQDPIEAFDISEALRRKGFSSAAGKVAERAKNLQLAEDRKKKGAEGKVPREAKSPFSDVSDEDWSKFAASVAVGKPSTVTPDYRLGTYGFSMRQLADLGVATNLRRGEYKGKQVWLADLKGGLDAFLKDPDGQLRLLAEEAKVLKKLVDDKFRAVLGKEIEGKVATTSGLIAAARVAGMRKGIERWVSDPKDRATFTSTTAAYKRSNGIF